MPKNRKQDKLEVGRASYTVDQKHQYMKDRRAKRLQTREAVKRNALRDFD